MSITLKRQLTEPEKQAVIAQHGRVCFATGHAIADGDSLHFDHIRAFSSGGASDTSNIAPMCETHNKQKGTLSLEDFRVKLQLQDFFRDGDDLTLKDLLKYLRKAKALSAFGESVSVSREGDLVTVDSAVGKLSVPCYICPITSWPYFYARLKVDLIDSDDDEDHKVGLQPRYLIFDKVFELYRHFQSHPVLQPSIGRLRNNRLVLFDGQHKIAALLWNGRREFECKIYLAADLTLLNETNISAHDKFAQTRFYSSIMVDKLGAQFGADFQAYKDLENGDQKSEAGFVAFLKRDTARSLTAGDVNKRFKSFLYESILRSDDNKASDFVSKSNRSSDEKPLTIDMLSKSLFANFLYTEPVTDSMATEAYLREKEIANNVALINLIHSAVLASWKPKHEASDGEQRKNVRILRSKAIMAWSELLKDAVCGKLDLQDQEDRARPFYREISKADFDRAVAGPTTRLMTWKRWRAPAGDDIDRILSDNKTAVKEWLKSHGLTTGYLMGASE